jgi:LytS/YehU family sensor histidine kinase
VRTTIGIAIDIPEPWGGQLTRRRALAGDPASDSVGLGNVDERLRSTFGDDYGLVVETAPGAGTKVIVRVPKFAPGVTPAPPPRSSAPA